MWQLEPAWWVAIALAALLLLALGHAWLTRLLRRLRIRGRQQLALSGEQRAEDLLRAHGYFIEGAQVPHQYVLECDGQPHTVRLRADYLVRQNGRRYLAEVKTGSEAPSLTSAGTRRQLLEYAHAYDVDGVLLVDMTAGQIHAIAFPTP
jgi:hypothetical protein